jgi:hypothetical protein
VDRLGNGGEGHVGGLSDTFSFFFSFSLVRMVYISLRDEGTLPKTRDNNNNRELLTAHPLDYMRNSIARTAAQIRPGHWRSAVYLKRIRKMAEDKCWFCQNSARMTRSHVLLHCPSAKLRAARAEA